MIYAVSLSLVVKRVFPKQVQQSTMPRIIDNLVLDPDVTNMDVVMLGPKDFSATRAAKVTQALANRHPDICVIYLYTKDDDKEKFNCEYKFPTKKITEKAITAAYNKFVGDHQIRIGKGQVTSADFIELEEEDDEGDDEFEEVNPDTLRGKAKAPKSVGEEPDDIMVPLNKAPKPEPQKQELEPEPEPEPEPEQKPAFNFEFDDMAPIPESITPPPMDTAPKESPVPPPVQSVESALGKVLSYEDWTVFKENLQRDSITSRLIIENSEYAGLCNLLDVLDMRIETVWRDATLTPEMKFDKIKEIGLEKSVARAAANSISTEKVIKIISTIILSAKRTVDEKVASVNASIGKIIVDRNAIMDTSYIDKAINERLKIQTELLAISRGIMDLYKSVDTLVKGEIAELDSKLPSANAFINDMVKPVGTQIFTPSNTQTLANKLMRALQENKILASQMEESINALIEMLFELCSKDEEIIRYQENMINMLKAHRVEDVIVVNSALKRALNIYTGADNTGRSATAITWSGVLSRRKNCLLLDITGRAKFKSYGMDSMSLMEFMVTRVEQPIMCVESDHKLNPEEVQKLLSELRARLNYYSHINIIVAPEDTDVLNQLSEEAMSVSYITNCSTTSMQVVGDIVKKHTTTNVARKLVVIDTPVSPLMIADNIGIDPTQVKLITLPNLPAIRACALRFDRPYEFTDVVKTFEEAFRT